VKIVTILDCATYSGRNVAKPGAGCPFETGSRDSGKSAELAETDANWYSIADRLSRERFSVCERDVTPRCEACG
jgi:hypothetical protein